MPFRDIRSNQVFLTAIWTTKLKDARRSPRVAFFNRLLVVAVLLNEFRFHYRDCCWKTTLLEQLIDAVKMLNPFHCVLHKLRPIVTRSVA
jgi:hypothetical protein